MPRDDSCERCGSVLDTDCYRVGPAVWWWLCPSCKQLMTEDNRLTRLWRRWADACQRNGRKLAKA